MRPIFKCSKCEKACVDIGVGFCSVQTLYCTYFGFEVDEDDGCTFGIRGKPKYKAVHPASVNIENHAIVYGW